MSEILTTFGYTANNKIFLWFMSKTYKQFKDTTNELELSTISGENPMNKGMGAEHDLKLSMEASKLADENEQLLVQINELKKKEQASKMRFAAGDVNLKGPKKEKKKIGGSNYDSQYDDL